MLFFLLYISLKVVFVSFTVPTFKMEKEFYNRHISRLICVFRNRFVSLFQLVDCVILDDGGFLLMSNQEEYISLVSHHQLLLSCITLDIK